MAYRLQDLPLLPPCSGSGNAYHKQKSLFLILKRSSSAIPDVPYHKSNNMHLTALQAASHISDKDLPHFSHFVHKVHIRHLYPVPHHVQGLSLQVSCK